MPRIQDCHLPTPFIPMASLVTLAFGQPLFSPNPSASIPHIIGALLHDVLEHMHRFSCQHPDSAWASFPLRVSSKLSPSWKCLWRMSYICVCVCVLLLWVIVLYVSTLLATSFHLFLCYLAVFLKEFYIIFFFPVKL